MRKPARTPDTRRGRVDTGRVYADRRGFVRRLSIAFVVAAFFASSTASCRDGRSAPAASPPTARTAGETGAALLAKVSALDDFAPCLIDVAAGVAPVRLVDAEVAGDAARATFACANGALRGTVTFFRVAGVWMISTKELVRAPRRDR
jgi:hypothetical protein